MSQITPEELEQIINRLKVLLNRLPECTPQHDELQLLLSRAEKQRDALYKLDAEGEHFVEQVNKFLDT